MVVHIRDMDGLMEDEDDGFTGGWSIVCNSSSDNLKLAASGGSIIATDIHNLSRAQYDHRLGPDTSGISVGVQFERGLFRKWAGLGNCNSPDGADGAKLDQSGLASAIITWLATV
ncbi:unnamed protein product [Cylindrotheca closterium]|uniref:Uncharacterized protein n=1 Tax=Cylindrotheca closterium TaxID=2856 RepID=A0AAD2GCV4_9STRA|nr:unnamed protein product [Cylindrotheca closterium]